jgi:signal transduction histidine kinase
MNKRKKSIRMRILFMVLSLIVAIFLVVFAVFNLLVGEYIKSSVNEQLKGAKQIVFDERTPPKPPPDEQLPPEQSTEFIREIRRLPRGPVGRAEIMIVSGNYELIFPDANIIFIQNYDEINELAKKLKTERVDIQSNEIMPLKASGREYYFVSVEMPESYFGETAYLVYYIDMTAITSFSERINKVLLAVMGVAGILAAAIATILSGRIARPIRELTRFAVRIGQGDFSKSTLDYQDIELSELAGSMNKAAAQLDAYDREQKTFFQNVSHELRTPLQSIKCNAEGIEHGILDPIKSSRVIISETDRLSEMVEDLLYLSRIDNVTGSGHFEESDLREILSNCAERQRSLATERDIQFVFAFDDQPVNIYCDEKRMSRAFSNLISNAIRYAKSRIILSCHAKDDKIIISVVDDGEGIAIEDLPHIFNRFYKGNGGKHGIGLSIVKSVIEQHKGKIEVKSTGTGASFTIVLTA